MGLFDVVRLDDVIGIPQKYLLCVGYKTKFAAITLRSPWFAGNCGHLTYD